MDEPFDTAAFGPTLARLIREAPMAALDRGRPRTDRRDELASLTADDVGAEGPLADPQAAACCLAGVWLAYGFLDEAHELCQSVPSPAGSYWHGVVHRREGDFGNAQYWFRQAGDPPIGALPAAEAARHPETVEAALGGVWDPARFVDLVRAGVQRGGPLAEACVRVQQAEWRALMAWCVATG